MAIFSHTFGQWARKDIEHFRTVNKLEVEKTKPTQNFIVMEACDRGYLLYAKQEEEEEKEEEEGQEEEKEEEEMK